MINFADGRNRVVNYIEVCKNIADSYPFGFIHGLQKDVIQNSLDARAGKKTVQVRFELIHNEKGIFLTITDTNTVGLTGEIFLPEEYTEELGPEDHWARFESFAFTKNDPGAIGARGQGKFIFLRSSNIYTMFYDTLRSDGVYRLGATQATTTACPILPSEKGAWEGESGRLALQEHCGLAPLDEIGTRIIIANPEDELIQGIKDGYFGQAIGETWFRAIEKNILEVSIDNGDGEKKVPIPSIYPLAKKDKNKVKTWILGNDFQNNEIHAEGIGYKIKRFHAIYDPELTLSEELQGIAIIHNGMKIVSLEMPSAPAEVAQKVTGYIEFDSKLDQELRKKANQDPNHYELRWRSRIPRAIKEYVNNELQRFGQEKLGLGVDPRARKHETRTNAEEWALRQLMKYAKDLDLFGAKGVGPLPPPPDPTPVKDIGISINGFAYPLPAIAPRVNWDSKFSGLTITAYNKAAAPVKKASMVTQILLGGTQISQPVKTMEFELDTGHSIASPVFEFEVSKKIFKAPGEYRLNAALFEAETGKKIDSVARRFWVEIDPPLRQPFQVQGVPRFNPPHEFRQWLTDGALNSSPTFYYNTAHPAYLLVEDDNERLGNYLLDIMIEGAIQFVLRRRQQDGGTEDFYPLEKSAILGSEGSNLLDDIPFNTYHEISRYISEIRWRINE